MSLGTVHITPPGDKLRDGGDWCFGIVCECGKRQVHHAENIRRGLPRDFSVAKMMECWLRCPRGEPFQVAPAWCRAEFVTVEDGCSMKE